jgi:hypothetical protein
VELDRRLWRSVCGSAVGVVVVVSACWFGWYLFKKRYRRKVLRMKPEAV